MGWTAGWNTPGYLPEVEPFTAETWEEARDYLLDAIVRDEEYAWELLNLDEESLDPWARELAGDNYNELRDARQELLSIVTDNVEWCGHAAGYLYWIDLETGE